MFGFHNELLHNREIARTYYQKSIIENEKLEAHDELSRLYYLFGVNYNRSGRYNEAITSYEKSIEYAKIAELPRRIGMAYTNMSAVESKRGNIEEGLTYANRALEMLKNEKDSVEQARVLNNIGGIYTSTGRNDKALEYYFRALEISETVNEPQALAHNYNDIAVVYMYQQKYGKAIKYLKKTYEIREKLNDKHSLASVLLNLGTVYSYMDSADVAISTLYKALSLSKELDYKAITSRCYVNLGEIHNELNMPLEAINYLDSALKEQSVLKEEYMMINIYGNKGKSYIVLAETKLNDKNEYINQAVRNLQLSVDIAFENQFLADVQSYLPNLVLAYEMKKDFETALIYNKKFHAIKDSLTDHDFAVKIADLEAQKELVENEKKTESMEQQLENRKNIINVGAGGLIVTVLLVIIIFIKNRALQSAKMSLKNTNEHLEERIAEKTRKLQNANEEKKELLNLFSHTFRTKVMHLQGYISSYPALFENIDEIDAKILNLINENEFDSVPSLFETRRVYKQNITLSYHESNKVLKNVTELMDDMQTAIAMKDGKYTVESHPISSETFKYFIETAFSGEVFSKELTDGFEINIKESISGSGLEVNLEETHFQKIIKILLLNSREYTSEIYTGGSIQPRIEVKITEKKESVEMAVCDNGCGFTQQALDNLGSLINPGRDVLNTFDGLGLGLYIASEIMKLFGGSLIASNNSEGGACVTLIFSKV
jgi:signal transduction histidine kinase/Tfp pilus assembly protein PilF